MHFLEQNEIAEWCREHGIAVDDDRLVPALDPVRVLSRMQYATAGARVGRQRWRCVCWGARRLD